MGILRGDGHSQADLQSWIESVLALVNELKARFDEVRTQVLNLCLVNPTLAISSNFDVVTGNAIDYLIDGRLYTLATAAVFDTGTSQVIATSGKWSSALLSVNAAGTKTLTWSATLDATDEATAIAALPALPANNVAIGYITVQSHAANTWTAGTDALTTGTGGNVAQATNYYNHTNPNAANVGAAISSSDLSLTQ
jgi:hypothetical protein